MKKLLLTLLCAGTLLQSHAQDLYPILVTRTYSGIDKLIHEQPYVVQQIKDSFGDWINTSKNVWEPAEIPGYKKYTANFNWTDNAWNTLYSVNDSFVLNQDNQISVAIEKSTYAYSGTPQKYKYKYTFTYNPDKTINTFRIERAASVSSNAYGLEMTMKLFYDPSGKRMHDSTYYQQGYREYTRYQYNQNNQVVAEYGVAVSTGDTVTRVFYSYEGAHLKTIYSERFNSTADNWELRGADSMEINNGQVTNRISYAWISYNGDLYLIPNTNENFTYNTDGTLNGIVTKRWNNSAWTDFSKTEMIYADGKPMYALIYAATESGYEESPYSRYLFNFLTGVNEPGKDNAISTLYPNPASTTLKITLNNIGNSNYTVLDYTGKRIAAGTIDSNNTELDLHAYPNGIYYLNVRSGDQTSTRKFVVAK